MAKTYDTGVVQLQTGEVLAVDECCSISLVDFDVDLAVGGPQQQLI